MNLPSRSTRHKKDPREVFQNFTAALIDLLELPETPKPVFDELTDAAFNISIQPKTLPPPTSSAPLYESVREAMPRVWELWGVRGGRPIR